MSNSVGMDRPPLLFAIWAALFLFLSGFCLQTASAAEDAARFHGEKYVLSFYHWNIQYVLGSEHTEDLIIRESFEPVLDLYARHPGWKVDFEMQGRMVEVMHERHPEVFEKFKRLVDTGQIELTSCHYSDQFALAYPREDLLQSIAINQKVFDRFGLKLSPISFLQEDQFGEGVADVMKKNGKSIAVVMGGLNQFADRFDAPLAEFNGMDVVAINRGGPNGPVWDFTGDAELAVTGDNDNPYFGYLGWQNRWFGFKTKPKKVRAMEARLLAAEARGKIISSIGDYVAAAKAARVTPYVFKFIPDKMRGTFTNNVFLWMGDNHNLMGEDDIRVLSANATSRNWLLAAQTAVAWSKIQNLPEAEANAAKVTELWRIQSLAEGSDATGMGLPFPGEVRDSLANSKRVKTGALEIIDNIKMAAGLARVQIDTRSGEVNPLAHDYREEKPTQDPNCDHIPVLNYRLAETPSECGPVDLAFDGSVDHEWLTWTRLAKNRWRVTFGFVPLLPRGLTPFLNTVKIKFRRTADALIYSPALLEDQIREIPLNQLAGKDFYLPLSNGLIGLGEGLYVIKENMKSHMAAHISSKRDDSGKWVSFEERNPVGLRKHLWSFIVIQGSAEEALQAADQINVHPKMIR